MTVAIILTPEQVATVMASQTVAVVPVPVPTPVVQPPAPVGAYQMGDIVADGRRYQFDVPYATTPPVCFGQIVADKTGELDVAVYAADTQPAWKYVYLSKTRGDTSKKPAQGLTATARANVVAGEVWYVMISQTAKPPNPCGFALTAYPVS